MNDEHGFVWWMCAGLLAAMLLWIAKPTVEVITTILKSLWR